jgi:formyl-CoA transferase
VVSALQSASVPVGRIYTIKDIAEDPHYRARGMIQSVKLPDGFELAVPGVVPVLSATPGSAAGHAPTLGEHTDAVLGALRRN